MKDPRLDYSDPLTEANQLLGELRWLFPDGKWAEAHSKSRQLELIADRLARIALERRNAQEQPRTIYAHIPVTDAVGVDGGKASSTI